MKFVDTTLTGVLLIEPEIFADDRGFFMETYNAAEFRSAGIDVTFVQDNHSSSRRNALRGLHYQEPYPQGKLVRVVEGTIFDVAVNITLDSPQFGQWTGVELSSENKHQLWIPPGFAHGFCVLSEQAEVIYKCTALYDPSGDRSICWDDPDIAIRWPIGKPLLSSKDSKGRSLRDAFSVAGARLDGGPFA